MFFLVLALSYVVHATKTMWQREWCIWYLLGRTFNLVPIVFLYTKIKKKLLLKILEKSKTKDT